MIFVSKYASLDLYIDGTCYKFNGHYFTTDNSKLIDKMLDDFRYGSKFSTIEDFVENGKTAGKERLYEECSKLALQQSKKPNSSLDDLKRDNEERKNQPKKTGSKSAGSASNQAKE